VETVQELPLAVGELVEHLIPTFDSEGLGGPVEELAVTELVLDLRRVRELALQTRGLPDERPFEVRPHDLGVRVELDHPGRGLAVLLGHVVFRAELPRSGAFLDCFEVHRSIIVLHARPDRP